MQGTTDQNTLGFKQERAKMPSCHPLHITEVLRFRSSGERTGFKVKAGGTTRCESRSRMMRSRQDPQRERRKAGADPTCPLGSVKSRSRPGLVASRCACAALPARAAGWGGAVIVERLRDREPRSADLMERRGAGSALLCCRERPLGGWGLPVPPQLQRLRIS